MDEYIKRSEAIESFDNPAVERYYGDVRPESVIRVIERIPAADVRSVVFCRDCIHSEPWYADKSRCFLWHESGIDVFNDGFCNYGKKREES